MPPRVPGGPGPAGGRGREEGLPEPLLRGMKPEAGLQVKADRW